MRIALVSPPCLPVPPPGYGGTELIVAELARSLTKKGHETVVYATGDSDLGDIEIRSYFTTASTSTHGCTTRIPASGGWRSPPTRPASKAPASPRSSITGSIPIVFLP